MSFLLSFIFICTFLGAIYFNRHGDARLYAVMGLSLLMLVLLGPAGA